LTCLSVFTGGCTLEAAEVVSRARDDTPDTVLDRLTRLVDHSLVQQEAGPGPDREPRLVILETIHEYARERLEHSAGASAIHQAHAAYYLALAERGEVEIKGKDQVAWVGRLEAEIPNLRAAVGYLEQQGESEQALRLIAALWSFWLFRGQEGEWLRRLEALLSPAGAAVRPGSRARALCAAGFMAVGAGHYKRAQILCTEALALGQELGDRHVCASALQGLGDAVGLQGDYPTARTLLEESVGLFREVDDRDGTAWSLSNLGHLTLAHGDTATARALFEESLRLRRALDDRHALAFSLWGLAETARVQGDLATARALYEETLATAAEVGAKGTTAAVLSELGTVALDATDYALAHAQYGESLVLFRDMGAAKAIGDRLSCFAVLAAAQAQPARALRLAGAATALYDAIGELPPAIEVARWERRLAPARQALSAAEQTMAWAQGQTMTLDHAITYALNASTPD